MVEKLSVQIELVGGKEVEQEVTGIAKSFDDATKSIASLGTTGAQALNSAAAAAQKFGASTQQLQQVEGTINALNARSKDSNTAFSVLAANYDNARVRAGQFAQATKQVGEEITKTTAKVSSFRPELTALHTVMTALGVPFGGLVSTLGRVGTSFGIIGAGAVAVAGGAVALIKFAESASATEKTLTQLQAVSGQSFKNLSALSTVFAQGGTSVKQFATEFGNLSEKIASAGEETAKQDAISKQLEDIGKGLKATTLPAITLKERVDELLQTLSRVPPEQQWFALADIFKNLGTELERARLGKALGLSPETIISLSQGSERLRELQAEAERLGLTLTTSNQSALQEMTAQWNQFTSLLSVFFQKMGALAAPVFASISQSAKQALAGIVADFQNLPLDQAIANLGSRLAPAFTALGQTILPVITAMGTALGTALADSILSSLKSSLTPQTSLWDAIFNDFAKFGESIVANAVILGEKIGRALAAGRANAPTQSGEGFAGGGFADGGFIGGHGTGTSDSNLAWVSRGEYITPAAAVAQPGVLAFLEALRRSGGNLRNVLDGMGRFALGGMVPRPAMAFAGGGLAGGMSNVTIQFPGLPAIGGLRASSAVVDELHRAAALAQVRSGGRKPSRYS